ncbi:MAG: hypothetical protein IPL41_09060 [Micropruina sp.]|nr:hypothetical protein [Micropruina sp.]
MHAPLSRSRLRTGVTGLMALVLAGAGIAATPGPAHAASESFCADGSVPMATVAEVEAYAAGTAVTGSSVVQGTAPSGFTGSYLGHLDDGLGKGKDLLLFQLSSPTIDGTGGLKAAGIWAGMSGSPVYAADGSLIGAVSYSLNYDNLPVAGVTPAEHMKAIGGTLAAPATIRITPGTLTRADGLRPSSAQASALNSGSALHQVATANVAVASAQGAKLTNALLARVPRNSSTAAERLRSRSFAAVGTAAAGSAADDPLVAGGNIAVLYSTGDALLGGVGTVTVVCGNDVWAFGHPMDFAGATTYGLANASAAMVVPDATGTIGSYKQVSAIGDAQGMITQDRLVGVKGTLGAVSGYPVTLTVRSASGVVVDSRSSTVVLPEAGPGVTSSLVGNAVIEDLDNYYRGTLRFTWSIGYRTAEGDTGTLTKSQIYAGTDVVAARPAMQVEDDLYSLIDNGFTDVEITRVAMNLTLVSEDAVRYGLSGVQYRKGQTWVTLSGKTLKAGTTYSVRPVYRKSVNDKLSGPTITGATRTVGLSKKATSKGSLRYSEASGASECDIWDDCEIDEVEASSFDELIDELATVLRNDQLTQTLGYSRKGTSSYRSVQVFTGPGVVEGSVKVSFKVS